MNREQAELVRRVCEFQFDDPEAARPFSARLAEEQAWSREFTRRAIDEYRRFAVLATAAGHPVCPSKAVDEVWHLHLLYTQNYWKQFCGDVLKRPLHHEPSRGGGDEFEKHRKMYAQTLQSYRAIFAEEPPADIWPPIDAVFGKPSSPRRNTGRSAGNSSPLRSQVRRHWPWIATGGTLSVLPIGAHIIERTVYRIIANERNGELQVVHRQVGSLCAKMLDKLRELGLIVSRRNSWNGTVMPILVMAALTTFGVAKIIVGTSRHRPVEFLILACIGTMFAAVAIFGRRLHRTPAGDRELAALQEHFSDLRDAFSKRGNSKPDARFPLAVGLFGMGLLATTTMAGLANAIEKSARGGGAGCGTGCGGGGCGGGGCGGGGCGGCSG